MVESEAYSTVLERMRAQAEAWEATGDRRCVFLDCYALMTGNMLSAIDAGRFHDPAWVRRLLDRFAEYYWTALETYEQGGEGLPLAWKHAHDIARQRLATIEEDLLLGINAHINHDLPLALRDLMVEEWPRLSAEQRASRMADHLTVNTILAETTDEVQHQVIDRFDHMLGFFDNHLPRLVHIAEWEVDRILGSWRKEVWTRAVELLEAEDEAEVSHLIEAGAVHRIRLILTELRVRSHLMHHDSAHLVALFGAHHDFNPLHHRSRSLLAAAPQPAESS